MYVFLCRSQYQSISSHDEPKTPWMRTDSLDPASTDGVLNGVVKPKRTPDESIDFLTSSRRCETKWHIVMMINPRPTTDALGQ